MGVTDAMAATDARRAVGGNDDVLLVSESSWE